MAEVIEDEVVREQRLLAAQAKAVELFDEVRRRGLLTPGVRETEASDTVRDLAGELFGVVRYWRKRIVRAGQNTLRPDRENPPDRVLAEDDIVFVDFGPTFEEFEADFGRTFVLGGDPAKQRLRDDLPVVWSGGRDYFHTHPDVAGAERYAHVEQPAADAGWEFGGAHAGHLVGQFPHETIDGDRIESSIAPGSDRPMRRTDRGGLVAHWIPEVHLIDRERRIDGFFEELLDLGSGPA